MHPSGELSSRLHQNGVRTIIFGHPVHNSFPVSQLRATVAALAAAGEDPATNCVLLRSKGSQTFSAGGNLNELIAAKTKAEAKAFFSGFARLMLAMKNCPKPIVAAVQGKAIGGGVGIAAAADYCLATEAASVRFSDFAIAIGPYVVLPALIRKIGAAATSELTMDTEWHDAQWGLRHGLYQRLYPDPPSLYAAAEALAAKIAGRSQEATLKLKASLWQGTSGWPQLLEEQAEASAQLAIGAEAQALLREFKGK